MGDISLADVARALDAMLDDQMTGQARIAAHLVAAAEAAGHGPAVQPQASAFHPLLSSAPESDDVVAQGAQVREIDNEVYKYVGVAGVDRRRIVQVGNALAFEEQALRSVAYTSPVMTAVLAAFSEPDLLASARTSEYAEIRSVFEGLLGQQMIVQATLAQCFVAAAEAAAWSSGEIDGRLRRIVRSAPIGEITIATTRGDVAYTSLTSRRPRALADLPHADDLGPIRNGTSRVVEHPTAARATDGAIWKYVTAAGDDDAPRFVQVGLPIPGSSPVSPRFGEALPLPISEVQPHEET